MSDPVYLLDSNICIYLLEARGAALRARVEQCSPGELVASAITHAEVMRGIRRGDRLAEAGATRLFTRVPVIPFDAEAAARYRDLPFCRGSFDRLIAAHALARRLIVVTANITDFADVPGLLAEDWTR